MPPRSPTRLTARTLFTDPFRRPSTTAKSFTRSSRSPSASSTASTISNTSSNAKSAYPSSLNEILALSYNTQTRNASLTSFGSSRRPSCYSIVEAEEEMAEFGEQKLGLLEPRNSIGWWGMKEVLEERSED